MILPFEKVNSFDAVGNKAKSLIFLKNEGFNVPDGFVLDCDFYKKTLKSNGIENKVRDLMKSLDENNVGKTSEQICSLLDRIVFDGESRKMIDDLSDDKIRYAVRSSADKEDMEGLSFAGQYESFLNVKKEEIERTIVECYKSMFSPRALAYILSNRIFHEEISMCVIVQKMVDSDLSGVCFTVDPVSGEDTVMLIETADGLGENVVEGKTNPRQLRYDWYKDEIKDNSTVLMSGDEVRKLAKVFLKIQLYFGYPCDIEFAVKDGELFVLQARMITKIGHSSLDRMWTTADFKDGISATACKMMMWSLYEYALDNSLRNFYLMLKMLPPKAIDKILSNMFYARCYWNLSSVKKAMQTVVGFDEQDFENDYGITSSSSEEEVIRQSLAHSIRVFSAYVKTGRDREKNNKKVADELLAKLKNYKEKLESGSVEDIKKEWYNLTHNDFLKSESYYFSQIFFNTVHRAVVGKKLMPFVSESEKMKLLGNLENVSHMRPFYDIWHLSREIRQNAETFELFQKSSPEELMSTLENTDAKAFDGFLTLVGEYGYHSRTELDLTGERFSERPEILMKMLRDTVMLSDSFSPENDKTKNEKQREEIFLKVKEKFGERKYKSFRRNIEKTRDLLWWREELRDVSTRYYSVIRAYTLELSKLLLKEGAIKTQDDVWFLKIKDVWDYLDSKLTSRQLSDIAVKNRKYFNSFRNYTSENEIGTLAPKALEKDGQLRGICANGGRVKGTARVIDSFDEIDRIQENDILVTKHTDTGWTPKFAILSGIVTEYGGALCHCAIVSREYNIPAIVACEGVTEKIKDGQTITIDGDRAVVITEEEL